MNIRPIKSNKDYQETLKEIDKLWNSKPGTSQGDKLDILTTLVESYEAKHYPILPPDPVEAIKFRMDQQGISKSELASYVGGKNRATEILQRKRGLTVKMIRVLHTKLNIPAESLIA